MDYQTIFLSANERKKLRVCTILEEQPAAHFSAQHLAKLMDCSSMTVLRLLEEIDHDFKQLFGQALLQKSRTFWQAKQHRSLIYEQYLLRHSIPYLFCKTALLEPEMDYMTFCQRYFFSSATAARQLRLFQDYLAAFDIKLSVTKMRLVGPEPLIRLSLFTVIWVCSHGRELPDLDANIKTAVADIAARYFPGSCQEAIFLHSTITGFRTRQGHILSPQAFCFNSELAGQLQPVIRQLCAHKAQTESCFLAYVMASFSCHLTADEAQLCLLTSCCRQSSPETALIPRLAQELLGTCRIAALSVASKAVANVTAALTKTLLDHCLFRKIPPSSSIFTFDKVIARAKQHPWLLETITCFLQKAGRRKNAAWLRREKKLLAACVCCDLLPLMNCQLAELVVAIPQLPNRWLTQELMLCLAELPFITLTLQADHNTDCVITTFEYFAPKIPCPIFLIEPHDTLEELRRKLLLPLFECRAAKQRTLHSLNVPPDEQPAAQTDSSQ